MIAAAGADRLSDGMRRAFGKANSLAARVKQGQVIMEMNVKKDHLDAAKSALKKACVRRWNIAAEYADTPHAKNI